MTNLLANTLREARAAIEAAGGTSRAEVSVSRKVLRELDQAIARLEGTEPEKDLISVICHDLKDPLASIIMGAGFLKKVLLVEDAQARRVIDAIARSADRMNQVVLDFHDLAKLEVDRLPLDPRSCDVVPVVREGAAAHQEQAAAKSVAVVFDLPNTPLLASCDRARVAQIVGKLVANGIKFTPAQGQVTVHAEKDEGVVRVVVSDTGRGIPTDRLTSIFDHAANARRSPRDGPGLGLPIARGLVEAQRGTMTVQSRVGQGTAFSFTLPIE